MRRWLYIANLVLGLLFCGGLLVLSVAPEVAEQQFREALIKRASSEAVARYPELATVPSLEGLATSLYAKAKRLPGLARALAPVEQWTTQRYGELVAELIADLKIFLATNAVCFGLAALAVRREGDGRRTLILSLILLASALTGVWCYVFEQDWLHTILSSSYYGYGYAVFVALIAGALCDIAFNRGRVLRLLLEGLGQGVSQPHV